jgi:hypothetical protein
VTSSQGHNEAFLSNGQYVHAVEVGIAKHEVDIEVERFDADESVASASPDFNYSAGTTPAQGEDGAGGLAIQSKADAVVGGTSSSVRPLWAARVNVSGTLDSTFGKGGVLTTNIANGFGFNAAALVEPNGEIVGVGSGQAADLEDTEIILAKYFG